MAGSAAVRCYNGTQADRDRALGQNQALRFTDRTPDDAVQKANSAQKRWRRISGHRRIDLVVDGMGWNGEKW